MKQVASKAKAFKVNFQILGGVTKGNMTFFNTALEPLFGPWPPFSVS
jgi:hypothetical protein